MGMVKKMAIGFSKSKRRGKFLIAFLSASSVSSVVNKKFYGGL